MRVFNHSLMTRQLILSTRGSKKIINAMGTPACTFKQLWDNVKESGELFAGASDKTFSVELCIRAPGPGKLGPGGTDSPHFCMGQDCIWDSEEQHRG